MNEIELKEFCKNFKELRVKRGFTHESLAEKINTTHATISRWESGQHKPNFADFFKLMQALEVTFEQLAGVEPISFPEKKKPSAEEALEAIASDLGMEIRVTKHSEMMPLRTILPDDVAKKVIRFSKHKSFLDSIRGVVEGFEALEAKDEKLSSGA